MPAFLIPLGIAAANTAVGFIQQAKAEREAKKLREATQKNLEESRRYELGINRRVQGEARALMKSTSTAAELLKDEAKGDAANAVSSAAQAGGRTPEVANAVALAMKKSRGANVDAAKINESRELAGRKMLTDALSERQGIQKEYTDRVFQLLTGQAGAVAQLGQAGTKNVTSGITDMSNVLLAEKLGLFDPSTAASAAA